VIRKLGWGHFSTVWLSMDNATKQYVALKVQKSDDTYTESANDEIKLLKAISNADVHDPNRNKIVQLLDDFKIGGIHGTHSCMVMEVVGCNLLRLISGSKYNGIPLNNVRTIIRQVLESLDYLHTKCQIIHTDIKPENILVQADQEHLKYLHRETVYWDKWKIPYPPEAICNVPEKFKAMLSSSTSLHRDPATLSRNQRKKLKQKLKKRSQRSKSAQHSSANENNNEVEGAAGDSNMKGGDPEASDELEALMESERPQAPVSPNPSVEECELEVKLADLGNACWANHHFTEDIQTRQYRSPEVIIGAGYDTSADIWSVACMAFELATGEYLFQLSATLNLV